jgi:glyoxylase-like metal-dependent hydrolase (beta-lactamase superfamily II)
LLHHIQKRDFKKGAAMLLTRRVFTSALVASGAVLGAGRVLANLAVGTGTLTTVSDGHLVLPADFIFGPMPQDELKPIREAAGVTGDTIEPECNLALLRDGDRLVLFDAGSGPNFMPSAGTLLDSLEAAGVAPDEVTDVIFTHAHPDHIWGVLDDFDDPLFANAAFHIGQAEADYWLDPATIETIGSARAAFAVGARNRLEAIADGLNTFQDSDTVLPGVVARASLGHTPGHMSFLVNDAALVVGDAIGNHHVAFARPDWASGSDQDPETAAATRIGLMAELASAEMPIVGFHLPNGGMGRVGRNGDVYRFEGINQ